MRYFVPVLGFNVRGMASEAVGDYLAKYGIAVRYGFHCAPFAHRKMGTDSDACGGAVRVSPPRFTDDRQGGRADPRGVGAAEGAGCARTKMNEM